MNINNDMSASVDRYLPPPTLMHHEGTTTSIMPPEEELDQSMSESRLSENDEEDKILLMSGGGGGKKGQTQGTTPTTEKGAGAGAGAGGGSVGQGQGHEDDHVSKSSMSSMSAFMSSLVGLHSEDWSFCLQMDNAKPRDLPPPPTQQSAATNSNGGNSSTDSSSVVSIRPKNGISRWESAPSAPKRGSGSGGSGGTGGGVHAELTSKRPRAMRPWRPPAINGTSGGSSSNNSVGSGTKKADAPISRPQRYDSNRSLNAKRPQRYDSNRSLDRENSIGDLCGQVQQLQQPPPPGGSAGGGAPRHDSTMALANSMANISMANSMDLRVLLECTEEDDLSVVGEGEDAGVYLKIPTMLASEHSLWGSASTMTASFRTLASNRSLMSHYSKEWNSSMQQSFSVNSGSGNKCSSGGCGIVHHPAGHHHPSHHNHYPDPDNSHRSLFCKSEEERPIRPPRRTRSREMHFSSNACERPVRRPVRSPSDRSMWSSSSHQLDGTNSSTAGNSVTAPLPPPQSPVASAAANQSLLPPLNLFQDSSANFSFRLIRSLSEQTMETSWREVKKKAAAAEQQQQNMNTADAAIVTTSGRTKLKRTLSDSLLLFTESFANTIVTADPEEEEKYRRKQPCD